MNYQNLNPASQNSPFQTFYSGPTDVRQSLSFYPETLNVDDCIIGTQGPSYYNTEEPPMSAQTFLQQGLIMQEVPTLYQQYDGRCQPYQDDIVLSDASESFDLFQQSPYQCKSPSISVVVQPIDSRSTLEETKSEPQATTTSDNLLSTPAPAKRSKNQPSQLSARVLQQGKAILKEFNADLISSKVVIHSIFRNFKKYLVKKNKLAEAAAVQDLVRTSLGQAEYNALLSHLRTCGVIINVINRSSRKQFENPSSRKYGKVVQSPSFLQSALYAYKKESLLCLDHTTLQALLIVLPYIAKNVKYANTQKKKSPQTQDLPQDFFRRKVNELTRVVQDLIILLQRQES
ncbi:hypothetical protein FGO68_gene10954 [Halteria grandinella]|uniref:Uncharacterized protein n=1 Tax=Halteria grandinella TaxID=5974 RepID=A0A8J8T5A4_HALGN|nr:hypothetical protein FGO68_gene10954 [Halteria grandinella]